MAFAMYKDFFDTVESFTAELVWALVELYHYAIY